MRAGLACVVFVSQTGGGERMAVPDMVRRLRKLHRDRRGRAMIEIILILGAIALPLLIVLIAFGGKIVDWFKARWFRVEGVEEGDDPITGREI